MELFDVVHKAIGSVNYPLAFIFRMLHYNWLDSVRS
jgi:hypothetical protein